MEEEKKCACGCETGCECKKENEACKCVDGCDCKEE